MRVRGSCPEESLDPHLGSLCACSLPAVCSQLPATRCPDQRSVCLVSPASISAWASRAHYDDALLCPPNHHLHHILGSHRPRRTLVRAEGTQPRSDHHHADGHRCVLLPLLAHRHPGSAEPPVWAPAEERDHLVCALPVGVMDHLPGPRCPSSLDDPDWMSLETIQPYPPRQLSWSLCTPSCQHLGPIPPRPPRSRMPHLPSLLGPGEAEQGHPALKLPLPWGFLPSQVDPS
ncbi:Hypothetical predicted protein [Marmota monax]|uniref:Uncharacterized protein n=1 Tax=Marmota monax TaxID=9995 RepID=A0A5E4CRV9_MARMO|nr:Hypothetical predicted protein [Marmota monax]